MVPTRRIESLPSNNKRSSSLNEDENKPPSPKRHKWDDKPVSVIETWGSKRCVLVNGKGVKKGCNCDLNSGDEVIFGFLGNHAYIFQQFPYKHIIKSPPPDAQTNMGKLIHVERRSGDVSSAADASILVSLSNLQQDLSRLKPICQAICKSYRGNELPSSTVHEKETLGPDVDLSTNLGNEASADATAVKKILPLDGNVESCLGARCNDC